MPTFRDIANMLGIFSQSYPTRSGNSPRTENFIGSPSQLGIPNPSRSGSAPRASSFVSGPSFADRYSSNLVQVPSPPIFRWWPKYMRDGEIPRAPYQTPYPLPSVRNFVAQMNKTGAFQHACRYVVEIQIPALFSQLDAVTNLSTDDNINWAQWFASSEVTAFEVDGVQFPGGTGLASPGDLQRRLMLYCFHAQVPGYSFNTENQRIYGSSFKVPIQPEFQDVELQFYCGQDMIERWFFEGWMHSIMEPLTLDFNYIGEYSTSIDIYTLDRNGIDTTYSCTLMEAYPISINQMDVSYESDNEFLKLSVTFTYKRVLTLDLNVADIGVNNVRAKKRHKFEDDITPVPVVPSK